MIHHGLESHRRVCKSKEHDSGFEEATIRSECSLPFISFFHTDIVVSPSNVEFGEYLGAFEMIDEFGDEGEGVSVFYRFLIEFSIILSGTKFTILFLNQEERGGHWGF